MEAVVANVGDTHAQTNAQVALALAAMRLGDNVEALQALEAAIELEPKNFFALGSLGSLPVIAGAFAAELERFRQALAVAPYDLISAFNLVQALLTGSRGAPQRGRPAAAAGDRGPALRRAREQSQGPAGQHRQPGSTGRAARGCAAGRRELLPPGPAIVRGNKPEAVNGGAQRGGGHGSGRAADQRARYLPQPQDPSRELERPGPGLPDPRGHETADV